MKNKSVALSRAQSLFTVAERRDDVVKAEIARERAAVDAKTAKLRALRLEKEEADRITAPAQFFLVQNEELLSNTDNGKRACQLVKGPRKMVIAPNMTHNDVYGVDRWKPLTFAVDWFDKYLKPAGAQTRIPVNRTEPERGECDPEAKLEIEGIGAGMGLEQKDQDAAGRTGSAGAPPPIEESGRWN